MTSGYWSVNEFPKAQVVCEKYCILVSCLASVSVAQENVLYWLIYSVWFVSSTGIITAAADVIVFTLI